MATYIILSRVSPDAFVNPHNFRQLISAVSETIKEECPGVTWKASYATLGRFDFVDVVEAEDPKEVERASMVIRSIGRSITETMAATPWAEFVETL
ncbi:MAG: GYD domain-containing protein [bacterium]